MRGIGTILNVAAIVIGGILGMTVGKRMKKQLQETLKSVLGITTMFLGAGGAFSKMLAFNGEAIQVQGSMMLIMSLTLGALIGEWIDLDGRFEAFGRWLRHKSKSDGDSLFIDGFVISSLTVCIGAMAIIGAIEDGISGNYSILAAKAVLDLVIVMVLSASLGKGCMFAAIPVGIWQGLLTLLAVFLQPVFTPRALDDLSLTGNVMIFMVGLNLIREERIRVANLLPGLLVSVLWAFIPWLNESVT